MKSLSLTQPHALIVIGIPGSGKTYFASKFSDTFNAPFFDVTALVGKSKNGTKTINEIFSQIAKTKQSILIEPASASKNERLTYIKSLKSAGYAPLYIWVQTDIDTARQRTLRSRTMTEAEFETSYKRFTPPSQNEQQMVISGKHTFATQAKATLKRLSTPRVIASHQRRDSVRKPISKIQ